MKAWWLLGVMLAVACGGERPAEPAARPSILLVTLDTTRADAVGPEAAGIETQAWNALAARGRRFHHAYATAPETLPSHSSLMTGLYPAGHGVHQNARPLRPDHAVLAERLRQAGYGTAAFVSSFVLARRFGLARGFEAYDDELPPGRAERSAARDDRARAGLSAKGRVPAALPVGPLLRPARALRSSRAVPHPLREPPVPGRGRGHGRAARPAGAGVRAESGGAVGHRGGRRSRRGTGRPRGVAAREPALPGHHARAPGAGGAGHGSRRGRSPRERAARFPHGPGLGGAGIGGQPARRGAGSRPRRGHEAVPLVRMAAAGDGGGGPARKAIQAGRLEVYDLVADPAETRDLAPGRETCRARCVRRCASIRCPSISAAAPRGRRWEPRSAASSQPGLRGSGSRAARAHGRAAAGRHGPSLRRSSSGPRPCSWASSTRRRSRCCEEILAADPGQPRRRVATGHRALVARPRPPGGGGLRESPRARARFAGRPHVPRAALRARAATGSARCRCWSASWPSRPTACPPWRRWRSSASARGGSRRRCRLRQRIHALRRPSPAELRPARAAGHARAADGPGHRGLRGTARASSGAGVFAHDLELGVLYLAARRFADARDALDRVPPSHPAYPMALFKRAQVSVLLKEPDQAARIEAARKGASDDDASADRARAAVPASLELHPRRHLQPPRVEVQPRRAERRVVRAAARSCSRSACRTR